MTPTPNPTAERVCDVIAETIRRVDGRHSMGAGALGEHIEKTLRAHNLLSEGAPSEEQIEAATWALIDWDTDIVDRGVRDEHYRERRAEVERIAPILTSAGVAPQGPRQNETKSGQDFVSLDPEKVADFLEGAGDEWQFKFGQFLGETGSDPGPLYDYLSRALCEAAKRGELWAR